MHWTVWFYWITLLGDEKKEVLSDREDESKEEKRVFSLSMGANGRQITGRRRRRAFIHSFVCLDGMVSLELRRRFALEADRIVSSHRQTIEIVRTSSRVAVMMRSENHAGRVTRVVLVEDSTSMFFFHSRRLRIKLIENQIQFVRPK